MELLKIYNIRFCLWINRLTFFPFITLCILILSLGRQPHLITVALVNKCITHELIHGSFSSAPYGPTVKQLFKVFANMCFLHQCRQSVTRHSRLLHFTSQNCTDKTPQELEKCRSAHTFKRDREEEKLLGRISNTGHNKRNCDWSISGLSKHIFT